MTDISQTHLTAPSSNEAPGPSGLPITETGPSLPNEAPAAEILRIFDQELDTAATAERRGQKIYRSLQQLSQLIGGEYGDRVIYELIQNAHDPNPDRQPGKISIRLVVEGADRGELYVANEGSGFGLPNVQAIRNIANSTKEIGEGIGNKGVGFRSVEALTNDPRIYSQLGKVRADRFLGYCFRFALPHEVEARLRANGHDDVASAVAAAMPRYLAAVPVDEQPDSVLEFARQGYLTVVSLALRTTAAVQLAIQQVNELVRSEAPVMLFLERVKQLDIEVEGVAGRKRRRTLTRQVNTIEQRVPTVADCQIQIVKLGPQPRNWLVVRRLLDRERVVSAVERSIDREPALKRWLEWKGNAVVSVATPLDGSGLKEGRLYNFLPMGAESKAPTTAHLDAPFFTALDRRRARLDLPLNAELLDATCEACAAAALEIARNHPELSSRIVVDLVGWSAGNTTRLQDAFRSIGAIWEEAQVWPTSDRGWSSIRKVRVWPEGSFKALTPNRVTSAAGAAILSSKIDRGRVDAIRSLARSAGISIEPSDREFAAWAEAAAVQLPTSSEAAPKLWTALYDELARLLPSTDRLRALAGRKILLNRESKILGAGPGVYVRLGGAKRGRSGGPPLPPRDVARKLSILSSEIAVRPETFAAFERAGLWKRFDATEILGRLATLFGDRPAPARRQAALLWAFEVWKHDMAAAKKALKGAQLHVPTRGGWAKATLSAFSESWTRIGKHLDQYLAEARPLCRDANTVADRLLVGIDEWPGDPRTPKSDWTRFLFDAGVVDGLVPVITPIVRGPIQGSSWPYHLSIATGEGFDPSWREHHNFAGVNHPYTNYTVQGHAWRLPGQTCLEQMSEEARKRFAILAIQHLHHFGEVCLSFRLGRFERDERYQDEQSIRTPLSTFLTTAQWFPVQRRGEESFVRISEAWLHTDRRNDPKFVARLPDEIADDLRTDGRAFGILSRPPYGLRVWKDPNNAAARLEELAKVCDDIQQHERAPFRKQYDLAWQELSEGDGELSDDCRLVIDGPTGFSAVAGHDPPLRIYVRTGRDREIAKLLADTGAPILATSGEGDPSATLTLLGRARGFDPRLVDEGDVRLLVDGEPFHASVEDPLLADVVPWLADALVLGHELGARDFERSLQSAFLEERLHKIRLRLCGMLELQSPGGPAKHLGRYVYRDDDRPTIIVAGKFDAQQLSDNAAQLSALVHQNLRSFEPLLLRLASRLPQGEALTAVAHPTDLDYAFALQADVDAIHEQRAFRSSDYSRKLSLLAPVLTYFLGAELANNIERQLADTAADRWNSTLAEHIPSETVEQLLNLLGTTDDLTTIRRRLDLDYVRFNKALRELGRPPLSSEPELRRLFEVWKDELRPALRDRLRRHFVGRIDEGSVLREYADRRTLNFITFDDEWVDTLEVLDRETVRLRAESILEEWYGADPGGMLPELDALRVANRKAITSYAQIALPILRAAAGETLPSPWLNGASEVAAAADRTGALDFAKLGTEDMIATLVRAELWPPTVPQTLDLKALGLTSEDLEAQEKERARREAEEIRRRNSIAFGGRTFNTVAPDFAAEFAAFAEDLFRRSDWRARSKLRQSSLRELPPIDESRGGGGGGAPRGRVQPRPPEPIRAAMGLAGEILAYHYLRAKHRERFHDACWVSENRTSLFPEAGDLALGYDFRVPTTETEWLYEVKATTGDGCEFELSDNEYRKAVAAEADRARRYRIIFVQHVFDVDRCRILELPNPLSEAARSRFRVIGRGSTRMRFELG